MINPRRLTATLLTAALAVTTLTTPPATALSSVAGSSLSSLGSSTTKQYMSLEEFEAAVIEFFTTTMNGTIDEGLSENAERAKNNTDLDDLDWASAAYTEGSMMADLGDAGGTGTTTWVYKAPKDKVDDYLDPTVPWTTKYHGGVVVIEDDDYFYVFTTG